MNNHMDNYISQKIIVESTSSASSGPPLYATNEQIEGVINAFGANPKTAEDLRCAWTALSSFLEQRGALPARVEDISKDSLATYAARLRSCGPDDSPPASTLAALGTLLKAAGHSRSTLAALIVNTRRVRLCNGTNGRYRFERRLENAEPPIHSTLGGDDEALTAG